MTRHAQTIWDNSSRYKINYVIVIKKFLNHKEHQHAISGWKDMAILLKGRILPIGGVASGRIYACSLRSRLVLIKNGSLFSSFLKIDALWWRQKLSKMRNTCWPMICRVFLHVTCKSHYKLLCLETLCLQALYCEYFQYSIGCCEEGCCKQVIIGGSWEQGRQP